MTEPSAPTPPPVPPIPESEGWYRVPDRPQSHYGNPPPVRPIFYPEPPPSVRWLVAIYLWNAFGCAILPFLLPAGFTSPAYELPTRMAMLMFGVLAGLMAYYVGKRHFLALRIQVWLWWALAVFMAGLVVIKFTGLEQAVFGTTGRIQGDPIGVVISGLMLWPILRQCHRLVQYHAPRPGAPEDTPAEPGWDEGPRR